MRAIARPIPEEPPVTSALGTRGILSQTKAARRPAAFATQGEGEGGEILSVAPRLRRRPSVSFPLCRSERGGPTSLPSQGGAADADEPREGRGMCGEVLRR